MVGRGTRTKDEYFVPKPLIEINGTTIAEHSISSLGIDGHYIFIIRDFSEYKDGSLFTEQLERLLKKIKPNCDIIKIDYVTEGPASSALLAKSLINNNQRLIITNCDQRTSWKSEKFLSFISSSEMDGCVVTYHRPDIIVGEKSPYSFIKIGDDGNAVSFKEKHAISELALNGIHYWRSGDMFVTSAEQMILDNVRTNNEFYVSETYNYCVKLGLKIKHFPMSAGEFHALGDVKEISIFKQAKNENSKFE